MAAGRLIRREKKIPVLLIIFMTGIMLIGCGRENDRAEGPDQNPAETAQSGTNGELSGTVRSG